jgi:zinc protease
MTALRMLTVQCFLVLAYVPAGTLPVQAQASRQESSAATSPPPLSPAANAASSPGLRKVGVVEGITEYRLPNGLQVLFLPDASQPKVTVNLTVFVGSRHEGYGETGMAHLLEHMLFKGCPKFPDIPKALRDHGAQFNGTTWTDRTNYFETMPASDENLRFGIELEADRMVNSFIRREDLLSEFTVVRNEFERGENSPIRILLQRMLSSAYEWHNYGKSTIGNRSDIERVPVDRLRAFYEKYYRPDNAMLIVAGQFDEAKAKHYIQEYFGPLKNPPTPLPDTYTEEPPQDGERTVTLRRVGSVAAVGVTYHIPAAAHPDYAAVEVLEKILTDEPNGRLYQALVKTKLASAVFGIVFNWKDPGVIVAVAQTEPDKVAAARDALITTMETLHNQPITDEEVERARRQLLRDREQTLANSQQFAVGLSNWAACGDWRLFFLHRDRLEQVTAADVNRVAKHYLMTPNRTVGEFLPTKEPMRAIVPPAPDIAKLLDGYKGREAMAAGEAFDPTPENVEKRVTRGKVGGIEYAFLPKKTRGETVHLTLVLRFGNLDALQGKAMLTEVIGPMLSRGTKTRTRQQIKDEFDKLNSQVNVNSTVGRLSVTVETKRANLPAVLTVLRDVLREPTFPAEELELLKREQIQHYSEALTDPTALASNALDRKLAPFPPQDPRYTPTYSEAIERTQAITRDDLLSLYHQQIGAQAGQIAIVGDFDSAAVLPVLESMFVGWNAPVAYARIPQIPERVRGEKLIINTPDKANAYYVAGQTVKLRDTDPDYPALTVGNYALGQAPLASRLSVRVRGKEGLSYTVRSYLTASPLDEAGRFTMLAITNPLNMPKVEAAMMDELTRFLNDGVSADELEQAKKAYLQSMRVQRGNDGVLASQLATALYAGRTFAYYANLEDAISKLQPGDVQRAFHKALDPKTLVIIEAGDFKSQ